MKAVLIKNLQYGYTTLIDLDQFDGYYKKDSIQVSEVVEIEFVMLPESDQVEKQIAVIDNQIQSLRAESEVKLNELKQRKQELLAITYEGE